MLFLCLQISYILGCLDLLHLHVCISPLHQVPRAIFSPECLSGPNVMSSPHEQEECPKLQAPLLLQFVLPCTSSLHCNTPPICVTVLSVPLTREEREILSVLLHLCCGTPPTCIAICLPFVSKSFLENTGGLRPVGVTGMVPKRGHAD